MKRYAPVVILILLIVDTILAYLWLLKQPFFQDFIGWVQQNLLLYVLFLVLVKITGIVWPPLPGGLFSLASIPIIGWFNAFVSDSIGGFVGAQITYFLGKNYGVRLLNKLFNDDMIEKITSLKVKKHREIEALLVTRLLYGSVSEFITYGAGVIGIRYRNFFIAMLIFALIQLPIFYLYHIVFTQFTSSIFGIILLTLAVIIFFKLKGRYFE
jgi:uncharacterized membrane protein YdjX (TVP38/TMEM64 family)